jgi:hypothetical protein
LSAQEGDKDRLFVVGVELAQRVAYLRVGSADLARRAANIVGEAGDLLVFLFDLRLREVDRGSDLFNIES